MVNETGPVPAPGEETGPVLALQNVYLKDCSYEAPSGPRLDGNWNPQINLDLHTAAAGLSPELTEVVLTVTVSACAPVTGTAPAFSFAISNSRF